MIVVGNRPTQDTSQKSQGKFFLFIVIYKASYNNLEAISLSNSLFHYKKHLKWTYLKKCVSYYSHCSFYGYKFLNIGVHRKYMSYYSHCSFFMVRNFWNIVVQRNKNSFFTCYLKVVLDRFKKKKKKNLESVQDDSISHYYTMKKNRPRQW